MRKTMRASEYLGLCFFYSAPTVHNVSAYWRRLRTNEVPYGTSRNFEPPAAGEHKAGRNSEVPRLLNNAGHNVKDPSNPKASVQILRTGGN